MENKTDLGLSVSLLKESFKTWYRVSQNKVATCSQYEKMIQAQRSSNHDEWETHFPYHFELIHNGTHTPNATLIGEGAYAKVYETNNIAYKIVKVGDRSHLRCNLKELIFFHVMNHPRLLKPLASQVSMKHGNFYKIIHALPLARCSLFQATQKNMIEHWDQVLQIMFQIGEGLHYMHQNRIYHGDIKPHNILCRGKDDWVISDFTLTSFSNRNPETSFGSLYWRSPEACSNVSSGEASDVWSWGMLFLDLLAGHKSSFSEKILKVTSNEDLLTKYSHMWGEPDYTFRMTTAPADAIFDEVKDFWEQVEWSIYLTSDQKEKVLTFLKRIMTWDYKQRPTMETILKDIFWGENTQMDYILTPQPQSTELSSDMSRYMDQIINPSVHNVMKHDMAFAFTQIKKVLDSIDILYSEKEVMDMVWYFFQFIWFNQDQKLYQDNFRFDALCFHVLHLLDFKLVPLDFQHEPRKKDTF